MAMGTIRTELNEPAAEPGEPTGPFFNFGGTVDLLLVLTMVIFVVFGLIMLWSASYDYSYIKYEDASYQIVRQIIWMLLGGSVAVAISTVDYHRLPKFALPLMLVTIALLVLVQIIGDERNNAVRTLLNGSVQPSELAKLTIVVYLSAWLNSRREMLHDLTWGIIPFGFIIGTNVILILMQPDTSAAVSVAILGMFLFFLGGSDIRQFVLMVLIASVTGYFVLTVFSSTGAARISDFWAGLFNPVDSAEHVIYAFEAVSNGGLFGVGIGNSVAKYTVLPFVSTDSIFAVIAEELGLLGCALTVALYGMLAWRGFKVARRAPDMLGSLLAAGFTIWIVFEASINMLSLVGWFPFAGNALPFISYGGSSILMSFTGIGVILSVSRYSNELPETEVQEWRGFRATFDLRGRDRRRSVSRVGRSQRPNQQA